MNNKDTAIQNLIGYLNEDPSRKCLYYEVYSYLIKKVYVHVY